MPFHHRRRQVRFTRSRTRAADAVTGLGALAAASLFLLPTALTAESAQAATGDAPGAPGASPTWRTGDKDGVGTALSSDSKVWYTLAEGTLSEVYYPAADTANLRDLGFVVTDGQT